MTVLQSDSYWCLTHIWSNGSYNSHHEYVTMFSELIMLTVLKFRDLVMVLVSGLHLCHTHTWNKL